MMDNRLLWLTNRIPKAFGIRREFLKSKKLECVCKSQVKFTSVTIIIMADSKHARDAHECPGCLHCQNLYDRVENKVMVTWDEITKKVLALDAAISFFDIESKRLQQAMMIMEKWTQSTAQLRHLHCSALVDSVRSLVVKNAGLTPKKVTKSFLDDNMHALRIATPAITDLAWAVLLNGKKSGKEAAHVASQSSITSAVLAVEDLAKRAGLCTLYTILYGVEPDDADTDSDEESD